MNSSSYFAVFLGVILISSTFSSQSFADVISPHQQMKLDFTVEQVICAEGLVKITKKSTGNASCVKPATAEKLAENGWAMKLSEQKIDEIAMKKIKKGESAGTIKKIATIKQTSTVPKAGVTGYVYVFEACAISKTVRAPEVFITSDSETRQVKLGSMLQPASCYTSSIIIKAADPNSISATLLNKGGISETISNLESQIATLKSDIVAAKQKLPKAGEERKPSPDNVTNIQNMKKELKDLQDQLTRYLMVLYTPPTKVSSVIDAKKSLTGKPLDGMSTSVVSLTESVASPTGGPAELKRFNVVFEACAGKQSVRLPIISVTSDSDSVDVKLIDRIIPESCQVGVTRINATDSESIELNITNSQISNVVSNLENEIDTLQSLLADKRSSLGLLVSKQLDAEGEKAAEQLALEISKLRADLLETRAKLYSVMLGN